MKNGQYSGYYTLITVATALKKVAHVENNATTAKVVRASGGIGLRATRTIKTGRTGIGTPMDLDGGRGDDRWMGESAREASTALTASAVATMAKE